MFPDMNTDISWTHVEMMHIVHLIDDKSVSLTLVSMSVLIHGMNKMQHQ